MANPEQDKNPVTCPICGNIKAPTEAMCDKCEKKQLHEAETSPEMLAVDVVYLAIAGPILIALGVGFVVFAAITAWMQNFVLTGVCIAGVLFCGFLFYIGIPEIRKRKSKRG